MEYKNTFRRSDHWQLVLRREGKNLKRFHQCNIHVEVQQTLWEEIKQSLSSSDHQTLSESQRMKLEIVQHTRAYVESVIPLKEAETVLHRVPSLTIDFRPSDHFDATINLLIQYNTSKAMDYESWILNLHLTVNKQAQNPIPSLEALLWTIRSELNDFFDALECKDIVSTFRKWQYELSSKQKLVIRDVSRETFGPGYDLKEWLSAFYSSLKEDLSCSSSSLTSSSSPIQTKNNANTNSNSISKILVLPPENIYDTLEDDF